MRKNFSFKKEAASLYVDLNDKQEERKHEMLPHIVRLTSKEEPNSADRLDEIVRPSFIDKVK